MDLSQIKIKHKQFFYSIFHRIQRYVYITMKISFYKEMRKLDLPPKYKKKQQHNITFKLFASTYTARAGQSD